MSIFANKKENRMKKFIILSVIAVSIIIMTNCSPKVAKETAKTEKPATETKPATNIKNTSTGDVVKDAQGERSNEEQVKMLASASDQRINEGKQLYETSCKNCHELYSPNSRNSISWVEIMKEMGPKAKLQQGGYMMISAYLTKNAKP